MSSDTSGSTATPTPNKSEMDKLLEAIQASAEATRVMGTRFDGIERDLAEVKTGRTMATEGATPASASPFTPQVLRPGIVPGHIARPEQTPALATPTARGVSGFLVPVTPKSNKESAEVHVGIGLTGLTFGSDGDFRHLDATLSAEERIESSRRASDEVRQLKSQLWSTCLSIVQKENRSASPEEVIAKTDKMMSEHWLQIRKDRIMRMFDPSIRADVLKDSNKNVPGSGKKEWQRKISQSAPARIQNKLTHNNYIDWVSEVIGILAPIHVLDKLFTIHGATEVLEGIEHGQGYLEDRPLEQTEGYDVRLDLEIGGLLSGSVSAECRGYIVARQAKGEHRGSILWRDLVGIMRRGDGVDKAIILEQVVVQRQKASENVRTYAERLRTLFIKSGAIDAAFSDGEQVLYLLRGLHSSMEPHRASIRAFQSQRHQYTFDSALLFLIQQEAASVLDQHPSRLPLLSRPAANLASSAGPGPRRFHILRNNAVKGTPGYFNGECRHCHKWGHKQEDCAQRKREVDAGTIAPTPVQAEANAARVEDNSGEEPSSDFEGEIYELIDEDGEVMFARLATSPVGESDGEANVARAMMAQIAVASHAATVEKTDLAPATLEEFAAFHIPEKAVKWILDSGATHHMTSRSELLPFRIHSSANSIVHIADGTRAKIERRGACVASLFGDGGSEAVAVLKTVLVVPSFTNNLLSVQRLAEDGWTIQFSRTGAELTSPKGKKVQSFVEPGTGAPYLMLRSKPARWIDVKGVANRVGHVPVQATARLAAGEVEDGPGSQEEEALIQTDPQAKLWHRRLAHMSYFTLRILARDPAFAHVNRPGPKAFAEIIASEEPCDPCIESKQTLLPFGHSDSEAPAKMTDVCFDLTGQFEGNKEYRYSLNILEAWSRMTWALPIPNKEASTVFAVFLAWVELMKNQGHGTIKRLHCDHGGEFENHLFQEWAGKNGIAWCFSAPNTSEQNGLIERWNRTIQDRARAMLRAARLSDSFWPYAFRAVCEVINKSPSSGIGNLIPLTLWSSEPIDYDSMRVFGCLCWVVKPNKNRKNKLSVRAVRGTYLGPAPEHKAYLVYTPAERPFLRISRHVIFDESRLYDARFTLDQKQEHPGAASDIVELTVPRRTIKLSDVSIELDPAPVGTPMLEMLDEEDEAAWDTTIDNAISKEQQRGDSEDNWPSLDSVFGEEYDTEDLATNDWTGELKRHRSPEHMGPSVYGVRNSYPELDDLGSPINLDDLDGVFQHTLTRAVIEPTVGAVLGEAPQHRRSKRLQGQFGALSASVEIAFKAVAGEELIHQSRDLAAQAFSAAIRSSADGVLIEPKSLAEAMSRDDWDKWEAGMQAEHDSLKEMENWEMTSLPAGRKAIGCRWTYKLKLDADGNAARRKARLVAQGFSQRAGVDYSETFAPVARLTTVRILITLTIRHRMTVWSMDVVTAYLNGTISEDIYMAQPPHFADGTDRVCKLKRSLYGLKQSGREWFDVVKKWLLSEGFKALQCELCVFTKTTPKGEPVIIVLYVDDVLIAAKSQTTIDSIRNAFTRRFKMTDNGLLNQVLGLKICINHESGVATISQEAYILGLIRRFGLEGANPVDSPMTAALQNLGPRTEGQASRVEVHDFASIVGSLMWAGMGTRADVIYEVALLGRYMANPRPEHMVGAKRILRFLLGTSSIGLVYSSSHDLQIEGFCDADHTKNLHTRRSVSGYAFFIHGNLVSWRSQLQATVAISSTESEYVAMSEAAREAKWLRTFTTELGLAPRRATDIFTDNAGAYSLARNPEGHNRVKHIDVHHHYVRELVATQQVNVTQIGTDDNAADIFTKVTGRARLHEGMSQLGLGDNRSADA